MKINFWAVNLNMGDGSTVTVQFQTKKQAELAVKNNSESQGEDWREEIYKDCVEFNTDGMVVLGKDAEYYLEGIKEDM